MIEIKKIEELNALVDSGDPVVVDFWAPWCGPCKMMKPAVAALSEKYPKAKFALVNIDEVELISSRVDFAVRAVPTILVYAGGKEYARFTGATPSTKIAEKIEAVV